MTELTPKGGISDETPYPIDPFFERASSILGENLRQPIETQVVLVLASYGDEPAPSSEEIKRKIERLLSSWPCSGA